MKINVDVVLKQISGEVMLDADSRGEAKEATLGLATVNAILAPSKEQCSGVDKIKKYELAKKIYKGGVVDLSAEEIALCKTSVQEAYPSPWLVGQIVEIFEGGGNDV